MTLIPVWRPNIAGGDPVEILTLYSGAADHLSDPVYLPMRRDAAYGGCFTNYGETLWRLFCDRFHRPHLIYQWAIISPGGAYGLPTPARVHKGRTINGLDLLGGELEVSVAIDRGIHWPQKMQALPLLQWRDDAAFCGHGTTYLAGFVPRNGPTFDQVLGVDPVGARPAAGQMSPARGATSFTFRFNEADMHNFGANPVKLFQQYSNIGTGVAEREDVFAQLLNNIIIAFHIPDDGSPLPVLPNGPADGTCIPPAFQPPENANPLIGPAIWYWLGMELRVDPNRNPNAVAI
jgi:hypothetical protein